MFDILAPITALIFLVPGVFMAFIPMLPALSYMFIVSLVFAIVEKFSVLTGKELLILLSITIVSILTDHLSGIIGAKYGGAHTKSLLCGILCAFLGTFFFPPIGSFIGLFIGVLSAEIYYKKPNDLALKAASSALIGTAVGVLINIFLSLLFIATFFFLTYK